MSYAVEAMRGLSLGGPLLAPMSEPCCGPQASSRCAVPMTIGYRRASMR